MNYRSLGNTGIRISEISFGCGNTAGLMVQGTAAQQQAAVRQALDRGINYFDTAPNYGERIGGTGISERHLGAAVRTLGERPLIGTKVEFVPENVSDIAGHTRRSVEASLQRLGIEQADIVYLHNRVARQRVLRPGSMGSQLCPHRHMARVIPVPNGPSGRAQSGQCIGRGCSFLDSRKLGSRS